MSEISIHQFHISCSHQRTVRSCVYRGSLGNSSFRSLRFRVAELRPAPRRSIQTSNRTGLGDRCSRRQFPGGVHDPTIYRPGFIGRCGWQNSAALTAPAMRPRVPSLRSRCPVGGRREQSRRVACGCSCPVVAAQPAGSQRRVISLNRPHMLEGTDHALGGTLEAGQALGISFTRKNAILPSLGL